MYYNRLGYFDQELIAIYEKQVAALAIAKEMSNLSGTKDFSKIAFLTAAGASFCMALDKTEWVFVPGGNVGVFAARHLRLDKLFQQYSGKGEGFSKGRTTGALFTHAEAALSGTNKGACAIAAGTALAQKLKRSGKATWVQVADMGAANDGFHEILSVAVKWKLPLVFAFAEHNDSTDEGTHLLAYLSKSYGLQVEEVVADNLLQVHDAAKGIAKACGQEQKPYIVLLKHIKGNLPPLEAYKDFLIAEKVLDKATLESLESSISRSIANELSALPKAKSPPLPLAETADLFPVGASGAEGPIYQAVPEGVPTIKAGLSTATMEGLRQSMQKSANMVYLGGPESDFPVVAGPQRLWQADISFSGLAGIATGLGLLGIKAMVSYDGPTGQRSELLKWGEQQYLYGIAAETTLRLQVGDLLAWDWESYVPGLKVVYPTSAFDAKGLMTTAAADPGPVLFLENKNIGDGKEELIPKAYYEVEIGKARLVKQGSDITLITYGMGVEWATDFQRNNPWVSLNILDLRSLYPFDRTAIAYAVKHTGKVLVFGEGQVEGGIIASVAAWIAQHCMESLDAPVMRCGSLPTPFPASESLRSIYWAKQRLADDVKKLMEY